MPLVTVKVGALVSELVTACGVASMPETPVKASVSAGETRASQVTVATAPTTCTSSAFWPPEAVKFAVPAEDRPPAESSVTTVTRPSGSCARSCTAVWIEWTLVELPALQPARASAKSRTGVIPRCFPRLMTGDPWTDGRWGGVTAGIRTGIRAAECPAEFDALSGALEVALEFEREIRSERKELPGQSSSASTTLAPKCSTPPARQAAWKWRSLP